MWQIYASWFVLSESGSAYTDMIRCEGATQV